MKKQNFYTKLRNILIAVEICKSHTKKLLEFSTSTTLLATKTDCLQYNPTVAKPKLSQATLSLALALLAINATFILSTNKSLANSPLTVANPSFEEATLDGSWTSWGEGWRMSDFKDDRFRGLKGLVDDVEAKHPAGYRGIYQNIDISTDPEGTVYQLSALVRTINAGGSRSFIQMRFDNDNIDDNGNLQQVESESITGNNPEFKKNSITGTKPAGATVLRIFLIVEKLADPKGNEFPDFHCFDEISVIKYAPGEKIPAETNQSDRNESEENNANDENPNKPKNSAGNSNQQEKPDSANNPEDTSND